MSDLPAGALDYRTVVSEYFLALRGAGLMLSPLDEEVVADWERRGIPVAVVCRGLRNAVEGLVERRPGGPRSLRALGFAVEDEWSAYRAGRVGDSPPPPAEDAAAEARLRAARDLVLGAGRSAEGPPREGYRDAWRALAGAAGNPGTPLERVEAAFASADARIVAAWLAGLDPAGRRALGPRIRRLAGGRPTGASLRGYRDALRSHLVDAAREAGLTCLRGSV